MVLVSCDDNDNEKEVIPEEDCKTHYLTRERRYGNSTAQYYYTEAGKLSAYTFKFDTQESEVIHNKYFYGSDQVLDSVQDVFGGTTTKFIVEDGKLRARWRRNPEGRADSITMMYDNSGRVIKISEFLLQQSGFQETYRSFQYPNDSTVKMYTYFRAANATDPGYSYRGLSTFIVDGKKIPYPLEYCWLYSNSTIYLSSNIISIASSDEPEPVRQIYQYDEAGYPTQLGDAVKGLVYSYQCDPPQEP